MPPSPSSRVHFRAPRLVLTIAIVVALAGLGSRMSGQTTRTGWTVVAWNNLGMHCMDADFSVFSILPPYNTIQAQVVGPDGKLATDSAGIRLTYEAAADAATSINRTSAGKTNFWTYVSALFGTPLAEDVGLLNHNMPGSSNTPQPMVFDAGLKWFIAEGIPITPYDDAGVKNYYPMMKVTAKDASGTILASTKIVLPVSDEMDCSVCHSSGSDNAARPSAGWVTPSGNPQRDFRLNILRLHDEKQGGNRAYQDALAANGYGTGLYASATDTSNPKPTLCAHCHLSEALPGTGYASITPLTEAMHGGHKDVTDPTNSMTLEDMDNRSACYRCHPGSKTKCLRGVMGNAVSSTDGTMAIQCQDCHGRMSAVGSPDRTGWLDEPTCQQCHTGTATVNSGAIRFASVFDGSGNPRVAADPRFATTANTPMTGKSLYRFSAGHGGLQCSACHGSTHAEYPSSHSNDNQQSIALQGHVGTIAECGTCHTEVPNTTSGGPHGMHPVGALWATNHSGVAEDHPEQCQACHGTDYRGTVLSRSFGPRTLSTKFGTKTLFRGATVSCYMCHNGPSGDSTSTNRAPVATNLSASTTAGTPVQVRLTASDADGNTLTYRVVSQPANGSVSTPGISGTPATYFPAAGFVGTETFTYAAWDGSIDSNLATVTVTVTGQPCTVNATASAPSSGTVGTAVQFTASATASNCSSGVTYDWNFGDGTGHSSTQNPSHTYSSAGTFTWTMTAAAGGVTAVKTGSIGVSTATSPSPAPTITRVRARSDPFSLEIDGTGFQVGVKVFIGTDTAAWAPMTRVSSTRLLLTGGDLSAKFPPGTAVAIKVANPDGQFVTTTFTRRR